MMIKLVLILTLLSGCTITHRDGQLPKVRIDTKYADDASIKIRRKSITLELEWEL